LSNKSVLRLCYNHVTIMLQFRDKKKPIQKKHNA